MWADSGVARHGFVAGRGLDRQIDRGLRGQIVLKLVVETVLRLSRLQIEKAEHQRTGKTKER